MQYAIIVYETQDGFAARSDEAKGPAYWQAYKAYGEALRQAGVIVGGAALQPDHAGTTIRLRDGERLVQDGPYADTKEQLGGFYLIEVEDLDAALDWAARCPGAANGAVEVRPVLPMYS
ncbi:MAG TPA: YciI family protein [Anaerolineae bacterium]|nr:YciI family protein [Anaerolineae bacterium]HMR64601.1 YciI family protein [Anaerolineae bacterium]